MTPEVRNVFAFIMERQEAEHLPGSAGPNAQNGLNDLRSYAQGLIEMMRTALRTQKQFSVAEANTAVLAPAAMINAIVHRWISKVGGRVDWWQNLESPTALTDFYVNINQIGSKSQLGAKEETIRDIYYKCLLLDFQGATNPVDNQRNLINVDWIKKDMETSIRGQTKTLEVPNLDLEKVKFVDKKKPDMPPWVYAVATFAISLLIAGMIALFFRG